MQMLEAEQNVTAMQYRRDIVWPKLALRKLAGEDVKISKADVKKAFERNYGPRVEARAIVFNNSRRAREVWEKAQANPEDFAKLAQEYSVDPSSRALGGVIPPIPRHSGSKNLEDVAFKLKPGEISPVVQVENTLDQYIILKCEGRTVPQINKPEDVEDILIEQLREEKTQAAVHKVFEKIKSEARIDNYVTNISTGGDRKPSAAKAAGNPGAIKQTGASATKRKPNPPQDEESPSAAARPPAAGKSSGKAPAGKAPARAPVDE
jgi:foldase protein PrsA